MSGVSICVVALILDAVLGLWKKGVRDIWGVFICLLVFFLTSADAGVQVVSTMSSRGKENSQKLIKVIWGVILGLLAIMFIVTGGLSAVQSLSFAFSFPFLIIICLMLAGFFKYLKKEEFDK